MSKESQRLGKYELQKRLAHGGMGEVWKALDTQLNRYVAIKILRTDVKENPEFEVRFEQEARFVAALRHPNIVQIHDFSISEPPESETPTAYIVMDYIEGQTLTEYIRSTSRKGQFPPPSDIVYIFAAISRALDYAHSQGKIHRDIKPANILLDKRLPNARPMGEPILIDFGIARLQGVASGTAIGSLLGTPLYISPEQAQGKHGDHRSDLYSLGVILYEMMTGITPFRGDTTIAILMQHISEMPTPPNLINPTITPELSAVILKSLAKNVDDRYPNASALTIALAEALDVPIPRSLQSASERHLPSSPTQPAYPPVYQTPTDLHLHQSYAQRQQQASEATAMHAYSGPVTPAGALLNVSPVYPYMIENQGMPSPYNTAAHGPVQQTPEQWQQVAPPVQSAPRRTGRSILLIALLITVLLGSGVGAYALLFRNTPPPDTPQQNLVVGKLTFMRSNEAKPNEYDQLEIKVNNVPAPPAGFNYFAWLEWNDGNGSPPHIKLNVDNQTLSGKMDYSSNLFRPNSFFLITTESTSDPVVPYPTLDRRHYYADIKDQATSIDIKRCPQDANSTTCQR
jgi:serine/threonine protein kinase